jgi:hypothetical protein
VEEKQKMPSLVRRGRIGFFLAMGGSLAYLVRTDMAEGKYGRKSRDLA